MKKQIASLLILLLMASPLYASPQSGQKHIETIKKKVASCLEDSRHIVIETYDDRKLQGSIREAGPDSFVLSFQATSTTLNYADVKKIKWKSPMAKEVKAVIGAVAITGGLLLAVALLGGLRG
jgi:3-keto-L-gulonate-6-phosphate decarboxylase